MGVLGPTGLEGARCSQKQAPGSRRSGGREVRGAFERDGRGAKAPALARLVGGLLERRGDVFVGRQRRSALVPGASSRLAALVERSRDGGVRGAPLRP